MRFSTLVATFSILSHLCIAQVSDARAPYEGKWTTNPKSCANDFTEISTKRVRTVFPPVADVPPSVCEIKSSKQLGEGKYEINTICKDNSGSGSPYYPVLNTVTLISADKMVMTYPRSAQPSNFTRCPDTPLSPAKPKSSIQKSPQTPAAQTSSCDEAAKVAQQARAHSDQLYNALKERSQKQSFLEMTMNTASGNKDSTNACPNYAQRLRDYVTEQKALQTCPKLQIPGRMEYLDKWIDTMRTQLASDSCARS